MRPDTKHAPEGYQNREYICYNELIIVFEFKLVDEEEHFRPHHFLCADFEVSLEIPKSKSTHCRRDGLRET
jgi:hypothetical protein